MKITSTRDPDRRGCKDEWTAELEGSTRKGIGQTSAEAFDSLVRSNIDLFGITEWVTIDPRLLNPKTVWMKKD